MTALMALLVLSALGLAILSINTMSSMMLANSVDSRKSLYIAEAGIERGIRAVRDDVTAAYQTTTPSQNGYAAAPSLEGATATPSSPPSPSYLNCPSCALERAADTDYAEFYSRGSPGVVGPNVVLTVADFYQRVNLQGNTRINKVEIGCRFRRTGGTGTFQVSYAVSGTAGPSSATWDATTFNPIHYLDITADRSWTWADIGNLQIIATARGNAGTGGGWFGGTYNNYYIQVEYFFIRITYDIDAASEPWYSAWRNLDAAGSPKTVNIALGSGTLVRMPVYDESEKVHINYAPQILLQSLYEKCGIPAGTAATLAASTISYRSSKLFDSIEELRRVSGMTASYYTMVRDYVTVYSWVNTSVQRPSGMRAPVNINTAPRLVLEAVLDPVNGISSAEATQIANALITFRSTTPIICLFASDQDSGEEGNVPSLEYFLRTQCGFLTATQRLDILENADASVRDWGGGTENVTTTEFCYHSPRFSVTASGSVAGSIRIVKRVFEDQDSASDGIFNIPEPHATLNCWRDMPP